jgi:protein SCO1/2
MTSPTPAPRRVRGRALLLGLLGLLLIIVVPAIVVPTLIWRQSPPKLDDLGTLPGFQLVDHTGAAFSDASLRGHVTIANFVFTRCETVCPTFSMKMRRVQDQTADVGDAIKLVSFSVDPAYDTPPRLAEYAARFQADPARWRFVTGDATAMRAVVTDALMIAMDQEGVSPSGVPNIVHQEYFALIGPDLRIRGMYDADDAPRVETMLRHARYLARTGK